MRSLSDGKFILVLIAAAALGGCLVSDEPVLDASSGRAAPLKSGAYVSCAGDDGSDCNKLTLERDKTGLYRVETDDDETMEWRFRRIGRGGYAVQSHEGDEGYIYYYGEGTSDEFRMTMMMCADLPEDLRARLIDNGDLATDDEDFETCEVKSVKGLTEPAKAYHRGKVESEEDLVILLTPAPEET